MQRRRYPEAHDVRRARKESFLLYIWPVRGVDVADKRGDQGIPGCLLLAGIPVPPVDPGGRLSSSTLTGAASCAVSAQAVVFGLSVEP